MTRPEIAHDLAGRWVCVAGGTGRVGAACSAAFARAGANVVVHGSGRTSAAKELADELAGRYAVATRAVNADITDVEQLDRVVAQLGGDGVSALYGLVNCSTGYGGRAAAFDALAEHQVRRVLDVDLLGAFLLVQRMLPLLHTGAATAGSAKVVLVSSIAGLRGRPAAAHLCAAKAGVRGLALGLAFDLAGRGISVNVVAPGPVTHANAATQPPLPSSVAYSTPGDVAAAVLYLASPGSNPVQGQVLIVNGGLP
jgi:gluconate 5-dehydrogenase/3-oxoacyl-[acyl-carrier protein] reductase